MTGYKRPVIWLKMPTFSVKYPPTDYVEVFLTAMIKGMGFVIGVTTTLAVSWRFCRWIEGV